MRLMVSRWLIGIWNISDVERIVTTRVDEAASAPALKPSRTARSAANRKTAMATLITVSSVRRLLRLALFNTRPRNFTSTSYPTRLRSLAPNELRRGRPVLYPEPITRQSAESLRASLFRDAGRVWRAPRRADRASP